MIEIFSDGGSRGNPGRAAIGFVLKKEGNIFYEYAEPIGIATNNVAEYTAALRAIETAKRLGFKKVSLNLDSQLVERQLNGVYKVKSEELSIIFEQIKKELENFSSFTIDHVPRELNKDADRLVNMALDTEKIFVQNYLEKEGEFPLGNNDSVDSAGLECECVLKNVIDNFFMRNKIEYRVLKITDRAVTVHLDEKNFFQFSQKAKVFLLFSKEYGISNFNIEVSL